MESAISTWQWRWHNPKFRGSNFGAEERGAILESGKHSGVWFQSHFFTLAGWRYDGSTIRAAPLKNTISGAQSIDMMRRPIKSILASSLAALLLYYGPAWVVLRCCHAHEQGIHAPIAATADGQGGRNAHLAAWPERAPAQVDCLDLGYRTEILAAPSSPLQVYRLAAVPPSRAQAFLFLKNLQDSQWQTYLRLARAGGLPQGQPTAPPLYPSLSSLRISSINPPFCAFLVS